MDKVIGRDIKCVTNLLRRIHFASPLFKECQNLTGMHGYVLGYLSRECVKRDVFQKDLDKVTIERRGGRYVGIIKE